MIILEFIQWCRFTYCAEFVENPLKAKIEYVVLYRGEDRQEIFLAKKFRRVIMDKLLAVSKVLIEPLLSLNFYGPLFGVLIGVYITYKLTVDRERVIVANNAYKTVYGSFFIKLSTVKLNIEIKKKELGNLKFRKLNKQFRRTKNISLIAKQILDVSDDLHKMVKKHDQDKLSLIVISRFFAIEQIKEQIRLAEISSLGFGEDKKYRESRISRLNYELAIAKISFVQGILEDMKKISKTARVRDKETKTTIKYLLRTCRGARKNGVLKMYRIEMPNEVKQFEVKNIPAG